MEILKIILPIIVVGVIVVNMVKMIKRNNIAKDKRDNYMSEGMGIGLCFGAGLGVLSSHFFIYCVGFGMLIGFLIGMKIKK